MLPSKDWRLVPQSYNGGEFVVQAMIEVGSDSTRAMPCQNVKENAYVKGKTPCGKKIPLQLWSVDELVV